jgi:hypothetical protein
MEDKKSSRAFFSQVQEYVPKWSGKHINVGPRALYYAPIERKFNFAYKQAIY